MTAGYGGYGGDPDPAGDYRPGIDAGRLWAGGVATAVVAALAAVLGLLIARGVFNVAVLAPKGDGVWGDVSTAAYALAAAAAALLATGLMHLLSLTVPAAATFFAWIMLLLTLIALVIPFTIAAPQNAKVATALINLGLGLIITVIINSMAASARTVHRRRRASAAGAPPPQREQPPRTYRDPGR